MKKFFVNKPCSLKDFTDSTYPQGSFYFSSLIRSGDVRVNGVKVRRSVPLNVGDEVTYYTTPKMEAKPSHSTIYADEFIYVADKYSGVSTEALACELCLSPAHRLDRNTCGVLVFAKDEETLAQLLAVFKEHRAEKKYICICKDNFHSESADMRAYLFKDGERSSVKISDTPARGYVPIHTQYKVIERRGGLAMAEVTLHTGKTHQIRAHMAHIGCPVLGDMKYGDEALNRRYSAARQYLCSYSLAFELRGKEYSFKSSLAPSFPE